MYKSKHNRFILTPITVILKDAVQATSRIPCGIETYPMAEYVIQSIFLKMTGASEQKLRCICWDMATDDYNYRYEYIKDKRFTEFSSVEDKKNVLTDLCKQIKTADTSFKTENLCANKNKFIEDIRNDVKNIVEDSILTKWYKREFNDFCKDPGAVKEKQLRLSKNCILESEFWDHYKKYVYNHRNRCAHNLTSYQVNLPKLSVLASSDNKYENYFYRFFIMIFLDKIYIELYNVYAKAFDNI